ncbi:hypothetical protein [Nocardioides acrostichi]|uniref:Uncharacterized protein n=1 Tax=Nocardioides acrostichi TaxID=2784339 RepID=A0A930Y8B9_9ACTN|nr:hypothetical protein [Nocardioides acrostichi]MBF4162906.1 hypothetical protein [Nocardioides acrostichi]
MSARPTSRVPLRRAGVGLAGLALLATGALSGCGVAADGTTPQPGVGAQVGDATISFDTVSRDAEATCDLLQAHPELTQSPVTRAQANDLVVRQLVYSTFADELAQQADLDTAPLREQARQQARSNLSLGSDDEKAIDVVAAYPFFVLVMKKLVEPTLSADQLADTDQAYADYLQQWSTKHPIVVNPRFAGFTTQQGGSVSQELSVPVSSTAVAASRTPISASDYAALPASQKCS